MTQKKKKDNPIRNEIVKSHGNPDRIKMASS